MGNCNLPKKAVTYSHTQHGSEQFKTIVVIIVIIVIIIIIIIIIIIRFDTSIATTTGI